MEASGINTEGEVIEGQLRGVGGGFTSLCCGMLCAGLELVTENKKQKSRYVFVTLLSLKISVSSDACQQCFGSNFDKYM